MKMMTETILNEMSKKQQIDYILAIVKRAQEMRVAIGNQCLQFMDVDFAHKQFDLRLKDWLTADGSDFSHDFCGIQQHINRLTGRIEDGFLPRFASRKENEYE